VICREIICISSSCREYAQ